VPAEPGFACRAMYQVGDNAAITTLLAATIEQ
jgi:hypothetical protein